MNDAPRSWKIVNIPNMLSFTRILLIGPIIYCLLHEQRSYFTVGIILIVIAIATDFFDGILARKLNQISEVGKILDPLADKITIGALAVLLVMYKGLPLWVAVLIIGRDVVILIMGLFWATKLKYVVSSNLLGKWTAFFLALMIIAYLIDMPILEKILTWNAVAFTILSGISYFRRFLKLIRSSTD